MKRRPNVVLINPDHWRGEALAHMSNPAVKTPHLDALAQEGVSFRHAYCQNPVCTPSRCSFMTGWYPHVRGHRTMHHLLKEDEPSLLRSLKQNGYHVWWGGKNDWAAGDPYAHCHERFWGSGTRGRSCDPKVPWRGGPDSDRYYGFLMGELPLEPGEAHYPDKDWSCVHAAEDFIKRAPEDQPFCLFLALTYPHPPLAVEKPWFGSTDRNRLPPRAPIPMDWTGKPRMLQRISENRRLQHWETERIDEMHAVYYDMCSRVDYQYGLIEKALKARGLYEDTLIVFFSDHGSYAGSFGLVDLNQNTFEDVSTRVPFLVKPPAGDPCRTGVNDAMVELTDLSATVFEYAGIEPEHTSFGKSLRPVVEGLRSEHRDAVFCEGGRLAREFHAMELEAPGSIRPEDMYYPRLSVQARDDVAHGKAVMCRTKEYKYVLRLYEEDELYDLERDPLETKNRIHDRELADVVQALKERTLRFLLETGDVVPFSPDARDINASVPQDWREIRKRVE